MGSNPVLIVGLGELGGYVLEFLARVPNIPKIIAADIREDWGLRKTNSAISGASQFGLYPDIEFITLDAFNIDALARLLGQIQPAINYIQFNDAAIVVGHHPASPGRLQSHR